MGLMDSLVCLIPEPTKNCIDSNASLDGAVLEMQLIYQERLPYVINEVVGGLCLVWNDVFLALCRYAMSTDCMDAMSAPEREIWRNFVEFEDNHTYAAMDDQCDGLAVGATDPMIIDIDGESHPVKLEDELIGLWRKWDEDRQAFIFAIAPTVPDVAKFCLLETSADPLYDVPKAYVYDDLDSQFYNIHECLPYNTCGCEEQVILETNDCHNPGDAPTDPDAIYNDLYKTGCGTGYCSVTVTK